MNSDRKGHLHPFDPNADVAKSIKNLPHWFQPGTATFVTFRTNDSIPKDVYRRWEYDLQRFLRTNGINVERSEDALPLITPELQIRLSNFKGSWHHRELDKCQGKCELQYPENSRFVAKVLLEYHRDHYDLDCFVIMPNHVYVLAGFRLDYEMNSVCQHWMEESAKMIREQSKSDGFGWQMEQFDHCIRSGEQLAATRKYIADNPHRIRLSRSRYLYWRDEWTSC